jgi:predicted dienelactone hydrolase
MAEPSFPPDRLCARLQQQIALSTLMDDLVVATLASVVSAMRETGGLDTGPLEHAIRSHRVATLKQSAILGAVGIAT